MDDKRLDALIESALPETPPDDAAGGITPWRKAMAQVLWGIGLCAVTLNFLALNYILPAVGALLMLCGFRTLRRENRCFAWLYAVSALRAATWFFTLVSLCTIYSSAPAVERVSSALTYVSVAAQLITPLLLFGAIRGVQAKAGVKKHAAGAIWLLVWYSIVLVLGLYGAVLGLLGGILFIAAFVLIIRSLYKLYSELDEAGYAVTAAPGSVSNRAMTIALTGITLALMLCGYLFLARYPMDWQPLQPAGEAQTRAELAALGFPEDVLADLSDEDVAKCAGALRVVYYTEDYPVNDGEEVRETYVDGDGVAHTHISTEYPVKELRTTGVAVELPEGRWMVFHHFRWTEPVNFYGTESIQLWTPDRMMPEGWYSGGEPSGRVMYGSGGESLVSDFYFLGREDYTSNSVFFGQSYNNDIFAAYSAPLHAENVRGYVAYPVVMQREGWIFDSWVNYTHQQTPLQFPVYTAMQMRMRNSWNKAGAFLTVQTALQFHPDNEPGGEIQY